MATSAARQESHVLFQGLGVVADVAAVAVLIVDGGKPLVWASSLVAMVAGVYLIVRCWGRVVGWPVVLGLVIAVTSAGIFGYVLPADDAQGRAGQ